ncbi:MAG: aminoglycoside phosphotransferase family protein [Bacillus sp. (in: firmicutes)]
MDLGNPIAKGNTATIYLYKDKIIKIFNDYLPDTESSYEANKQLYAYSCGLPVPEILDVTKIDGEQAIIMDYIKGKTLGALISENIDQAEHYMNIFIDTQQKIHKCSADSLPPMSQKLRRQIESASHLSEGTRTSLTQKLDSMKYETRLCHGDYHPFNLIISNNQVTIIDWVDSSAGDRRADIYRTYLLCSQISTKLADMYLRIYCEKTGLSKNDIFQWAPIIAGARLSENVSSEKTERLVAIVNKYVSH